MHSQRKQTKDSEWNDKFATIQQNFLENSFLVLFWIKSGPHLKKLCRMLKYQLFSWFFSNQCKIEQYLSQFSFYQHTIRSVKSLVIPFYSIYKDSNNSVPCVTACNWFWTTAFQETEHAIGWSISIYINTSNHHKCYLSFGKFKKSNI